MSDLDVVLIELALILLMVVAHDRTDLMLERGDGPVIVVRFFDLLGRGITAGTPSSIKILNSSIGNRR